MPNDQTKKKKVCEYYEGVNGHHLCNARNALYSSLHGRPCLNIYEGDCIYESLQTLLKSLRRINEKREHKTRGLQSHTIRNDLEGNLHSKPEEPASKEPQQLPNQQSS